MDFIHTWALWPCNSIVLFHLISNPSETVHQLILQWRFSLFPFYPVTPPSCFLLAPLMHVLPLLCQHSQNKKQGSCQHHCCLSITSGIIVRACSCWVPLPGYCARQAPVWTWLLWLPLLCQHSQKIITGILLAPLLPLSITSGITVVRACSCWVPLPGYCGRWAPVWTRLFINAHPKILAQWPSTGTRLQPCTQTPNPALAPIYTQLLRVPRHFAHDLLL